MSYSEVQRVLQALLREQVSIRPLATILEVLVDAGRATKQSEELAEKVRERLGASICQKVSNEQGELHVMTLAPDIERTMLATARQRDGHPSLITDPTQLDGLLASLARVSDAMLGKSMAPVLLTPSPLRRHIRALIQRALPHVTVIGVNELPPTTTVRAFGTVQLALPA
jgi:flagellar biosynthesis protein FlhA